MATTASFLTTCITKLEMLYDDKVLGSATGFFYKLNDDWFIITNWHVLSGRYPSNGQPRHHSSAVPNKCKFYFNTLTDAGLETSFITYELYSQKDGSPQWIQHPTLGQNVDIAALPIHESHRGITKDLLDPDGHDMDMLVDLGAEVFIPGFPLGLAADGVLPLWKRASIASSLEIGNGAHTFFHVDTATREGMSGAPCLVISNWRHYRLDRTTGKVSVVESPIAWRLLGVYSGRLNPSDSFEAQIGKVWRESFINEILIHRAEGSAEITGTP